MGQALCYSALNVLHNLILYKISTNWVLLLLMLPFYGGENEASNLPRSQS